MKLEKLENILKRFNLKKEKEINDFDKNYNISFTKKEKFFLLIPFVNILFIKKIEKNFFRNFFKNYTYIEKEEFNDLLAHEIARSIFISIGYLATILSIFLYPLNLLTLFLPANGLFIFTALSIVNISFVEEKIMKDNVIKKNRNNNSYLENIINKEDFYELKQCIDIKDFEKLMVKNNFNISYKNLQDIIDEKRNEVEKSQEYSQAREIYLSKEYNENIKV